MNYPNPFDLSHDESEVGEMWIFDQIQCAGSGRIPTSGRPGTRDNLMCKVGESISIIAPLDVVSNSTVTHREGLGSRWLGRTWSKRNRGHACSSPLRLICFHCALR
jgi:hypothetical protein